jgi:hypothetical protein
MKTIYVVVERGGEYEESYETIHDAYLTKEKAEQVCENFNNRFDRMKLTIDDWLEWTDTLDNKLPWDDDRGECLVDYLDNEDIFLETIKKYFPDVSLKYSDNEIKEIFNFNVGNEQYYDPFYSIQEINLHD